MHKTAEEAIAAATKEVELSNDTISFEGQNCNDFQDEEVCSGWDGLSHRCECGNRRVYWETYGDPETGFHAFALAY